MEGLQTLSDSSLDVQGLAGWVGVVPAACRVSSELSNRNLCSFDSLLIIVSGKYILFTNAWPLLFFFPLRISQDAPKQCGRVWCCLEHWACIGQVIIAVAICSWSQGRCWIILNRLSLLYWETGRKAMKVGDRKQYIFCRILWFFRETRKLARPWKAQVALNREEGNRLGTNRYMLGNALGYPHAK